MRALPPAELSTAIHDLCKRYSVDLAALSREASMDWSEVATLAAGYADGYPRHLSNREASMLARGQRCPLLGRVTMDLMMIDVSNVEGAAVGDEVVLMGRQNGAEVSCVELAERADTITWEITTRIGARVRRVDVPSRQGPRQPKPPPPQGHRQ